MKNILLIEDDRSFARGFCDITRRVIGAHVEIATGIESANVLLSGRRFDAIILDLTLDDATPRGAISAIDGLAKHAPVVVVTGETGERAGMLRNLAMFNGAANFIQKDHLGYGGSWHLGLSIVLDAYLREKRSKPEVFAAA